MPAICRFSGIFRHSCFALVVAALSWPQAAISKPVVVTTLPVLANIAEAIGGVDIEVKSLTGVGHDPNVFSARPGHGQLLARANLLFSAGLGLEAGWLPKLIRASGNERIMPGNEGYFTGGDAIDAIGVPRGMTMESMDRWSPDKNPYWWLDPILGVKVAKLLAVRLSEIDPVNAGRYLTRAIEFSAAVHEAVPRWQEIMQVHNGSIITYHNTYVYFMDAMNIDLAGFIEPKAGIEPSTRHMRALLETIRKKQVRLIWVEPYNNRAIARRIAEEAGIRLMVLPDSIEGYGRKAYIGLFEMMVERIARWSQ